MTAQNPKQVIARSKKAFETQAHWESSWRDAYRYTLPQRDIMEQTTRGQPKGDMVFDSTGVNSTAKFANKFQSLAFPPFQDIISLEPGPSVPEDSKASFAKELEDAAEKFHASLHRSSFSTVINELLLDLAVGTGTMLFNEGSIFSPFEFICVPTPLVAFEQGPWGTVGAKFRKHNLHPDMIEDQWPDADQVPKVEEGQGDPDLRVRLLEVTYRDRDRKKDDIPLFIYDVIDIEDEKSIFKEPVEFEGTEPWIVVRWIVAANEVQGRGPILFALPDIRTANKVVELVLKNASLSVAGVWTGIDDGVLNPNTARIFPGVVIPVANNAGPRGPSLMPLERAGSFDVAQIILEDLRTNIKKALFDSELPPETATPRTATEFIARLRDLQIDTGSSFGRIQKELVEPIVMRGLEILQRKGIISLPEGLQINGNFIKVTIISPLAQQQKLAEVQTVVQWIDMVSLVGPELVMFGIKIEDLPEWIGRTLGVPEKLMRDKDERASLQELVASIVGGQAGAQAGAPPAGAADPDQQSAPPVGETNGAGQDTAAA